MAMLTCLPESICSWNYRVSGLAAGTGEVVLNFFSEQGSITLADVGYDIVKHGLLSGVWTLELRDQVELRALKPRALFRAFHIETADGVLSLSAESAFTRCFFCVQMIGWWDQYGQIMASLGAPWWTACPRWRN